MSLFKNAQKVADPAPKAKKSDKQEVHLDDLHTVAELDTLIKTLTALKGEYETKVKSAACDHFVAEAIRLGKRPENFRGTDGDASASIELRKRSSTAPLNEAEVTLLKGKGVKVEKKVIVQKLFGINPKYAEDEKMLDKVSKAIAKFVPEDFIVVQEEKSAEIVSDETIESIFTNPKIVKDCIGTVTTLAIKPKLEKVDIDEIIQNVWDLISPEEETEEQK